MNLTDLQQKIQNQVKALSGLDGGHVIWANQTRDRPSRPFIELAMGELDGHDHTAYSQADTVAPAAGEELTLTHREELDVVVQLRAFSAAVTGSSTAYNLANSVRLGFERESVQAALAPLEVIDRGSVRDATLMLETEHEGRAVLDLRFRVADLDTEKTTYIETATVQTTIGGVVHDLEFEIP